MPIREYEPILEVLADAIVASDESGRVRYQDALNKLRTLRKVPCVILLDLMMPVMSGPQFYAEQQRDPALSSIPVVVISADGRIKQKAASLGGEYIAKPVRIEQVLDAIGRHCADE
jgi:CheY-like chemotaxis protein